MVKLKNIMKITKYEVIMIHDEFFEHDEFDRDEFDNLDELFETECRFSMRLNT